MHSNLDKERALKKDVQGEWDALRECYVQLDNGIARCEPIRRIYSDCFLLHARNLIDFLCDKKEDAKEDDVLMVDFVQDEIPFRRGDILPTRDDIKNPYKRINKQLSHITYARLSKNQYNFFGKDGYYKEIFENIKKCFSDYNSRVKYEKFRIKI